MVWVPFSDRHLNSEPEEVTVPCGSFASFLLSHSLPDAVPKAHALQCAEVCWPCSALGWGVEHPHGGHLALLQQKSAPLAQDQRKGVLHILPPYICMCGDKELGGELPRIPQRLRLSLPAILGDLFREFSRSNSL